MGNYVERFEKFLVGVDSIATGARIGTKGGQQFLGASPFLTEIPLGIGGIFQSASFDVQDFSSVIGTCIADQNGTIFFEFSPDGANFDGVEELVYIAGNPLGFSVPIVAPFARITFENGAIAQGVFRLALLGKYGDR